MKITWRNRKKMSKILEIGNNKKREIIFNNFEISEQIKSLQKSTALLRIDIRNIIREELIRSRFEK